MKKFAIVVAVLLALGAGAFALLKFVPSLASGLVAGLDNWVAQQVVRIVNTYFVPELKFDSFAYSPPGTLDLKGVTLTAPDGTQVVKAATMRVTLAEVPKLNQTIVIEAIELKDATLRLLATPEGGFKGLVPFLKTQAITQQETVEEDVRLSKVLRIRKLSLVNGSLEYDDGTGAPPMVMSGLNLTTDVDEAPGQEGWYALDTTSTLGGLANLEVKGRLNVDTFATNFEKLSLDTTLADNTYSILPPKLQELARTHEMRGRMSASATGDVMLRDWKSSRLDAKLDIADFNVSFGDYKLPINSGSFPITMSEKRITMAKGGLNLLGGTATLNGTTVDFSQDSMPTQTSWDVQNLDLQEMVRVATPKGQPPRIAGILATSGNMSASANAMPHSVSGGGKLTVRDGYLANIPVVTDLVKLMNVLGPITGQSKLEDTFDADFDLDREGMRVKSLDLHNAVIVVKGDGTIHYDRRLDLLLTGGPMEKVQGLLGEVGKVIGKVTGEMVKYRVKGTIGNPQVTVAPLGL